MTQTLNSYKLFLDDYRMPLDCIQYMYTRNVDLKIYHEPWYVVRDYESFCKIIKEKGLPEMVSFDHDLADTHYTDIPDYNSQEKTGYHCAQWLINYCIDNELKFPEFIVHSMNPVGRENIEVLITNYKKHYEKEA